MGTETDQLHVLLFPLMAQGHLLPSMDMARLFKARGVKTTIITTPLNGPVFKKSIQKTQADYTSPEISLRIIDFPTKEAGLPEGLENLDLVTNQETHRKFFHALSLLQQPLETIIQELHPNGIIADMFFPWTADLASKYRIPRLIFHGTSFFSMCCMASLEIYKPHKKVSSDTEQFVLPGLPDEVKFTRLQLPDNVRLEYTNDFTKLLESAKESEKSSYGMLVNSFYELEPKYADYYKNVLGIKAWSIGPVSVCNRNLEDKAQRGIGGDVVNNDCDCIKWLDSKKPNSVVYVCFGTTSNFSDAQLKEIAIGLEKSGQGFIWVVRRDKNKGEENWLPEGYEERLHGKGLIIRGWAPQVLILDHVAVGGFVTHCGWNSALEGVSAGLPMVTWPIFAEQFFNEKLLTEILRIGVGVGVQQWVRLVGDFVKSDAVEKAVKDIMIGERAEEMRRRAKELGDLAKMAVEDGGSSYNDLGCLIQELRSFRA